MHMKTRPIKQAMNMKWDKITTKTRHMKQNLPNGVKNNPYLRKQAGITSFKSYKMPFNIVVSLLFGFILHRRSESADWYRGPVAHCGAATGSLTGAHADRGRLVWCPPHPRQFPGRSGVSAALSGPAASCVKGDSSRPLTVVFPIFLYNIFLHLSRHFYNMTFLYSLCNCYLLVMLRNVKMIFNCDASFLGRRGHKFEQIQSQNKGTHKENIIRWQLMLYPKSTSDTSDYLQCQDVLILDINNEIIKGLFMYLLLLTLVLNGGK